MKAPHRLLGRLACLGALTLALAVPLAQAAPAQAARHLQRVEPTDVFTGVVNVVKPPVDDTPRARTAGSLPGRVAQPVREIYTVTVTSVFEGTISTERVLVAASAGFGACSSSPLVRGQRYIFRLVRSDSDRLRATVCSSVTRATETALRTLARHHPDARPPVEQQSSSPAPTAEITPVGASSPMSFTRVAAPGAALVIVGLLGLFLVRRRA